MNLTDPIADLLTRIRNAQHAEKKYVDIPYSTIKYSITKILKEQGFILDVQVLKTSKHPTFRISLKYTENRKPVIKSLKRISKPGLRKYIKASEIRQVLSGLGVSVLSTPKGILTGEDAKDMKVGGEHLLNIW